MTRHEMFSALGQSLSYDVIDRLLEWDWVKVDYHKHYQITEEGWETIEGIYAEYLEELEEIAPIPVTETTSRLENDLLGVRRSREIVEKRESSIKLLRGLRDRCQAGCGPLVYPADPMPPLAVTRHGRKLWGGFLASDDDDADKGHWDVYEEGWYSKTSGPTVKPVYNSFRRYPPDD